MMGNGENGAAAANGLFPDDGMMSMQGANSLDSYRRKPKASAKPAKTPDAEDAPAEKKLSAEELLRKLAEQ